jgi:hypothetical protein
MPLVAFACPESAPSYGEAHEFDYCVLKCENRCLSPYLIAALASSNQRNHHKGKYISATSLSGCVRKLHFERTEDYAQEPKKVLYGYRGTVMHTVLEDATMWEGIGGKSLIDLGYLSEWHMKIGFCFQHGGFPLPEGVDASDQATWAQVECPECCDEKIDPDEQEWFVLGGTLDGAEPVRLDKDGTLWMVLHDLKTMKDFAITKFVCGDDSATLHSHTKDAYVVQANLYRYLGERSLPPEQLRLKGVKRLRFVEARLQAFAMGEFPYMGSSYRYRKHYKHAYTDWAIPVIEFFDDAWVEKYVKENGRGIYDTLLTERKRPSICPPEKNSFGKHSWTCEFCSAEGEDICPNPSVEWASLRQGMSPEDAYQVALLNRL